MTRLASFASDLTVHILRRDCCASVHGDVDAEAIQRSTCEGEI